MECLMLQIYNYFASFPMILLLIVYVLGIIMQVF